MLSGSGYSVGSSSSSISLVLRVHTNSWVVNCGKLGQELLLGSSVVTSDNSFLFSSELEEVRLFLCRQVGVGLGSVVNFRSEDRHERVVLIGHHSISNSKKSRLESSIHNLLLLGGVSNGSSDLSE